MLRIPFHSRIILQQGIPKIDGVMYQPSCTFANTNQWLLLIFDSLTGVIYALHNILNWIIPYLTHLDESMALLHRVPLSSSKRCAKIKLPCQLCGMHDVFQETAAEWSFISQMGCPHYSNLVPRGFCCLSLETLPKLTQIHTEHSSCSSFGPRQY